MLCRCGWPPSGGTRGWLCCRQAPGFPPVRLKEPIAGRRQGKRRGRGAGNTVLRPLTPVRDRLRSRVKGGELGAERMPCLGLTGRECCAAHAPVWPHRLRPTRSIGFTASAIDAQQGREAGRGLRHSEKVRASGSGWSVSRGSERAVALGTA